MRTDDSFGNGIRPLSHVEIAFFVGLRGSARRWRALAGAVRYRGQPQFGGWGLGRGGGSGDATPVHVKKKKKKKKERLCFFFFHLCEARGKTKKKTKKKAAPFIQRGREEQWNVTRMLPGPC